LKGCFIYRILHSLLKHLPGKGFHKFLTSGTEIDPALAQTYCMYQIKQAVKLKPWHLVATLYSLIILSGIIYRILNA
jgi:hypothetical protein